MTLSHLFWYRILFMGMLLLSFAMFIFRQRKRSKFAIRSIACILLSLEISALFPFIDDNPLYLTFMFTMFLVIVVFLAWFCFKIDFKTALFIGVMAYTTEHMGYELYFLITRMSGVVSLETSIYSIETVGLFNSWLDCLIYFGSYLVVYSAMYFLFARKIKGTEGIRFENYLIIGMILVFVIIDVGINAFVNKYAVHSDNLIFVAIISILNILLCFALVVLSFEISNKKELQNSLAVVEQLRNDEHEQFDYDRRDSDALSIKCHDLKHQIQDIGVMNNLDEKVIQEIINSVNELNSNLKTGNITIDTIFKKKKFICDKNNIVFSPIIDGNCLYFMDSYDVYSLLNNLIDNSIEALLEVNEIDKRLISLSIVKKNDFVSISIQNYCPSKNIKFINKTTPKTTKRDPQYHGYGFVSINHIVKKYKGTLDIHTKNNTFIVNILFEIPTTIDD